VQQDGRLYEDCPTFVLMFLARRREDERFWPEW